MQHKKRTDSWRLKPGAMSLAVLCMLIMASCSKKEVSFGQEDPIVSGWKDYTLGEYNRAVAKFEYVLNQSQPGSDEQLEALYGLASTWNLRRPGEDRDLAKELYQQVVDTAPGSDLAGWSLLGLARMKHLVPVGDDPDYDTVREAYQEVIDNYADHLAAQEAFIYLNSTLISSLETRQTKQALKNLNEYVENPDNDFIGPAWSLIAVGHDTQGNAAERLHAEEQALATTEVDPTNPFTEFAWQYWNLATIAEFEVGDFDSARTYYGKLIEEYPQDIRVYAAKQALVRMDEMEQGIRAEFGGKR